MTGVKFRRFLALMLTAFSLSQSMAHLLEFPRRSRKEMSYELKDFRESGDFMTRIESMNDFEKNLAPDEPENPPNDPKPPENPDVPDDPNPYPATEPLPEPNPNPDPFPVPPEPIPQYPPDVVF